MQIFVGFKVTSQLTKNALNRGDNDGSNDTPNYLIDQ